MWPATYEHLKNNRILKFYRYTRKHGYLSNFYDAPFYDPNGLFYPNSEQYYQAHKFLPHYTQIARIMQCTQYPGKAYRLSRSYTNYIREDWDKIKVKVMQHAIYMKFAQNSTLRTKLLATNDAYLVEDSPIDYFWGCGQTRDGENMLGRLLMQLRELFSINNTSILIANVNNMNNTIKVLPCHKKFLKK